MNEQEKLTEIRRYLLKLLISYTKLSKPNESQFIEGVIVGLASALEAFDLFEGR